MVSSRITQCCLVVVLGSLALAGAAQVQPKDSSDERAIRALVDQVNRAMTSESAQKGVAIMRGVVSDKAYVIVQPNPGNPSEALVGDKRVLLEILGQSLREGPRWGVHEIQQITIAGPIAYVIGETKDPNQDTRGQNWLNVYAKEDVGWRLIYSTPADDFRKAVQQRDVRNGKSMR